MKYVYTCAAEQFPPDALLRQAVEAEKAGFDAIACSDHLQPWWTPGEAGHAWLWLAAVGQATGEIPLGTAVTPPGPRHHPVLIAQAWATLETLFPGRPYIGIGSGESLNESPLGGVWPSANEQILRMREGLEIIRALFEGEKLDYRGKHFQTDGAYLHTRPDRRPPIYVSAFGAQSAEVAAEFGDGLWTLGDPEMAPGVIDAYKQACREAGREPGEIIIQLQFSWAESEEDALEGARVWKGAQPDAFYSDDWHDPEAMYAKGEREISDEDLAEALVISPDPDEHVRRIRQVEEMGATRVGLMNCSGAGPDAALDFYREEVLPKLRG